MAETVSTTYLADIMLDARARTLELLEGLDEDQLIGPKLRIVNPLRWEEGKPGQRRDEQDPGDGVPRHAAACLQKSCDPKHTHTPTECSLTQGGGHPAAAARRTRGLRRKRRAAGRSRRSVRRRIRGDGGTGWRGGTWIGSGRSMG